MLNLEKQLPSYKYSVTVSCLKVLRKLQKCGHLPSSSKIYRSYAAYGQYIDVRVAAMECLVDFVKVDGRWEDLVHLMDLLENEIDPKARHSLVRLLIDNPPFERARLHKLDKEELVERIWGSMKYVQHIRYSVEIKYFPLILSAMLSHDSQLRNDMVDLYYALYGSKRPQCLPTAELSAMFKPQKVIPIAEIKKRPASPIEVKPIPPPKIEPEPLEVVEEIISIDDDDVVPIIVVPFVEPKEETIDDSKATVIISESFEHSIDVKMEPEDVKNDIKVSYITK